MRQYTELWNYTLTPTSLPYGQNGAGPSFVSGWYRSSAGQYINRGYAGAIYSFHTDNYSGTYALQFQLNTAGAGTGLMFMSLVYGVSRYVPVIRRTATGVELGWAYYGSTFQASVADPTTHGDFNGTQINETGVYTVTFLKKGQNGSTSEVSAHVVSPSGVHYKSGWFSGGDTYNRNQLGSNLGGSGYWDAGTISVFDELTDPQADMIRNLGLYDSNPATTISPAGGTRSAETTVTLAAVDAPAPAGWTLRYTTDGNDPTAASTAYTAPFVVGSPFTPSTSVTVKSAYFNDDYPTTEPPRGIITAATYSFQMAAPAPTFSTVAASDHPLTWSNAPAGGSGVELLYTLDGSDPVSSGTRLTWAPGSVLPFTTRPAGAVAAYSHSIQVRAVHRHIATDEYSSIGTRSVSLRLDQISLSLPAGTYDADVYVTVSCASPGAIVHRIDSLGNSLEVLGASPQVFLVPWVSSPTPTEVIFGAASADALIVAGLEDDTETGTPGATSVSYGFRVGPPQLSSYGLISNDPVDISAVAVTPGAQLYYTVDGSAPTAASTPLTSGDSVSVASGSLLKVVSYRLGTYSSIAVAEVAPEYEVSVVGTSHLQDTRYHYYQSAQRLELTSFLGRSHFAVADIDVTTPALVDVLKPDLSVLASFSVFETGGSIESNLAPVAGFSGFAVRAEGTKHWSRFCFDTATVTVNADTSALALPAPVDTAYGPRIDVLVVGADTEVKFSMQMSTYDNAGGGTGFRHTLSAQTRNLATDVVTVLGSAQADRVDVRSNVRLVLSITGTEVTLTASEAGAGAAVRTVTLTGSAYSVEFVTQDTTTYTLPATIRTQSALGSLRLAPGSITGIPTAANATGTSSVVGTRSFVYDTAESVLELNARKQYQYNQGYAQSQANLRFDEASGFAEVVGNTFHVYDERLRFDAGAVFDVAADVDISIPAQVQFIDGAGGVNAATFSLFNLTGPVFSPTGLVAIRYQFMGASLTSATYAQFVFGATTTAIPLARKRRLRFRLARANAGTTIVNAFVSVDGSAEIALGSLDVPALAASDSNRFGMFAVSVNNPFVNFGNASARIRELEAAATFTETLITPYLVGAGFRSRGQSFRFGPLALTVPVNSVGTVYFNTVSGLLEISDTGFEPTDGRLLIGIFESDASGILRWTNTMAASLIRFREETELGLGDGSLIAVGSELRLNNGRVYWKEAGYQRNAGIGDASWHTPINHANVRTRKQRIRVREHQRINVSVVAPPTP